MDDKIKKKSQKRSVKEAKSDSEKRRNSRRELRNYMLMSISIFAVAVIIAVITKMLLLMDTVAFNFTENQASLVIGMIEGIVGALSAGIIVYQLRAGDVVEEHQNEIHEASFLFNYNQAFIANPEMTGIEMKLDHALESPEEFSEKDLEERQAVTNYLVYLESLAPLLLNDTISLEYADDLMAYRFFLAVNNDFIQQSHLFRYPQYYTGILKAYRMWEDYRKERGLDILETKTGRQLDDWLFFEHFLNDGVVVRNLAQPADHPDDLMTIGKLLYRADPFIYPSAFGNDELYAAEVIAYLISTSQSIFRKDNIYVAEKDDVVLGAVICLTDDKLTDLDSNALRAKFRKLPQTLEHTVDVHFNTTAGGLDTSELYICTLCVRKDLRGQHIGKRIIGELVLENIGKDASLHVLADNDSAIGLYEKCGFEIEGGIRKGYSSSGPRPDIYKMVRKSQPEDVLATNDPKRYDKYFIRKEGRGDKTAE